MYRVYWYISSIPIYRIFFLNIRFAIDLLKSQLYVEEYFSEVKASIHIWKIFGLWENGTSY